MNETSSDEPVDLQDSDFEYVSMILQNQDYILGEVAEVNEELIAIKYPVRLRQYPNNVSQFSKLNPFTDEHVLMVFKEDIFSNSVMSEEGIETYRKMVKDVYKDQTSVEDSHIQVEMGTRFH